MGAQGSKSSEDADATSTFLGGGNSERLSARIWREGVPFTLLHDQAFVTEKYQELVMLGKVSNPSLEEDVVNVSGTNEVSLEEMRQVVDAARVQLFTKHMRVESPLTEDRGASGSSSTTSPSSSSSNFDDNTVGNNGLSDLVGNALKQHSAETIASDRLRMQRAEIVADYVATLSATIKQQQRSASSTSTDRQSVTSRISSSPEIGNRSALSRRESAHAISGTSPASLFSVSSYRVQLEMLRDFRQINPRFFENGILAIVQTVIDFPPFVLREVDANSAEDALVSDTHEFCRSLLQEQDLTASQKQVLMLLLLAFGVSSGRIGLLLDFVNEIVHGSIDNKAQSSGVLQGRSFTSWANSLVDQLETYRLDYKLGTLEDGSLLQQFPLKTIANTDDGATDVNERASHQLLSSIATDGSFVYVWSLRKGLVKVGTGLNFTIAGRIYAQRTAAEYAHVLKRKRTFTNLMYGSGRDVTAVAREDLARAQNTQSAKIVHQVFVTETLEGLLTTLVDFSLFISFSVGEVEGFWIFKDNDSFQLPPPQWKEQYLQSIDMLNEDIHIYRAFYGSFESLGEQALLNLCERIGNTPKDDGFGGEEDGILYSPEILSGVLASSDSPPAMQTDSSTLILLYSVEGQAGLECEVLKYGDRISRYVDRSDSIYMSSLVFCGDWLYLSLLCPQDVLSTGQSLKKRQPRELIRVSPYDLHVTDVVVLESSPECDGSVVAMKFTKPLYSYITEGAFIYELEMSADRFQVQVFSPKTSSTAGHILSFVRSFEISIKQNQCQAYVSFLVNILKMELHVTSLSIAMPICYTNGGSICMFLQDLGSGSTDTSSATTAGLTTFHGVVFDCETGLCKGADVESCVGPDKTALGCFKRAFAGTAACFDARNNLIWMFDSSKSSLVSYKNTGKRISLNEALIPSTCARFQLDQLLCEDTNISTVADPEAFPQPTYEEKIAIRVLSFLHRNATASDISESLSEQAGELTIPFVADLHVFSFTVLLALINEFASVFKTNKATPFQIYCLQACLSVLTINIEALIRTSSGNTEKVSELLRTDLSTPLNGLIQYKGPSDDAIHRVLNTASDPSKHDSMEDNRIRVVTAALDLYTTSIHIFHSNMSEQLGRILEYLHLWEKGKSSYTDMTIIVRLLVDISARIDTIQPSILEKSETVSQVLKLIELAIATQKRQIFSVCAQNGAIVLSADEEIVSTELVSLINCITQAIFIKVGEASGPSIKSVLGTAFTVFGALCDGFQSVLADLTTQICSSDLKQHWRQVEKAMENGFVGILSPVVLSCGITFLRKRIDFTSQFAANESGVMNNNCDNNYEDRTNNDRQLEVIYYDFLKVNTPKMLKLMTFLDNLVGMIEPSRREQLIEGISVRRKQEVMESAHEYENNMDVTTELRIPGASRISITFDPQSRTEFNYDYVTFYKDKTQGAYYGSQCYSGRDLEFNWPGVGTNAPLVIDSDHCYVLFHSDSSNTDWGFKFTAIGEILEKKSSLRLHWMVFFQENVVQIVDESMKVLVDGSLFAPIDETELLNDRVLQSDLLRSGVCAEDNQNTNVLQLLQDFANPPEDSEAAAVIGALMERSGALRQRTLPNSASFSSASQSLSHNGVNTAVRAVAAAILHHNMWGMDAYAFAQNLRSDISQQMLRGWKNAQKMRDWFHLGDAADASIHVTASPRRRRSRRLRRQPSAFKGVSEEALQILCTNVVKRAKFLLELTPASFSYVSGAKRRWGLLAKYGYAIGKSSPSESPLDKWYNLLDELQAATELRNLFQYRRNSSERMKRGQVKSVTEQVLEFVQSDVDVEELRHVINKRNRRATSRVLGIKVFMRTLKLCSSMRLQCLLLESFASTLKAIAASYSLESTLVRKIADTSTVLGSRVHFDTGLSGCDESLRQQIAEAFGMCLGSFSEVLNSVPSLDNSSSPLIIGILKSCALDYQVEDSYLLHDSRILAQILRLLSSNSLRIRQAAQSILSVFLSRFVGGKPNTSLESGDENNEGTDAFAFQKQLIAAVGFQLDGVVSITSSSQSYDQQGVLHDEMYNTRPQYLPENSPGLTSPCLESTSVRWNHSFTLWLYLASDSSLYAMKVGDEVRHGPDWKGSGDDSGEQETGIVTAIRDSTIIEIRWNNSGATSEHTFDPKSGIFEIILADEGVGGVIFYKGNKTLVDDTVHATPWSHLGLFMNDQRQLTYKIACGSDKENVYSVNHELDVNEWTHIAIVQEEEILKLYVNGSMTAQHLLDPFLIMDGNVNASYSKIVESAHPFADSVDQYWAVHIPGALRIRVTFDPLCDIDKSTGFVRIYKDERFDECWGEGEYSGKYHDPERNFPGAQSNRSRGRRNAGIDIQKPVQNAIEVFSDQFWVYFHNEGSTSGWGFRLLASPEFPIVESQNEPSIWSPCLNAYPFYFGEPPNRVLMAKASKCWINQPKVLNYACSEADLIAEIQSTCPGPENVPVLVPNERTLHILGLIRTCSETSFSQNLIATPKNIGNLMFLAFSDTVSVEVRCGSMKVMTDLAAHLSPEVMNAQFTRAFPAINGTFLEFLMMCLSNSLNVWRKYDDEVRELRDIRNNLQQENEQFADGMLKLQISSESETSLIAGYISLARRMSEHFSWREALVYWINSSMEPVKSWDRTMDLFPSETIGHVLAIFALFGGTYDGVYIGGRVRCCVNIDGKESIESGFLVQFCLRNETRVARVLFDCDRSRLIDVPVGDVMYLNDEKHVELSHFLRGMISSASELRQAYERILQLNVEASHHYGIFKPKTTRNEMVEVLESEHPYSRGEDMTYPLSFAGANEIVIYFDNMSYTAGPNDYIQFVKRNKRTGAEEEYWGEEKYFGDHFPGAGNIPPLRITASSVDVRFHTESSSNVPLEWGFKLTAHAYEEVLTLPPEVPPSIVVSAFNDIRARCLKSLNLLFGLEKNKEIVHSFAPLLPSLTKLANAPTDGRPTRSSPKSQIFESKHPYSNSVMEYMAVTFSGASMLHVTFDPQSQTELGCDYLCFFKDKSLTDRWGAYQYSGVGDAANWPGVGERPPLTIPSDSFTLLWCTDASNVDWGWKFTVNAEFPSVYPLTLSLEQLNKTSYHMFEILNEKMLHQRIPFGEEFDGFEKALNADEVTRCLWVEDPVRDLIYWRNKAREMTDGIQSNQRKYRVIESGGVNIYKDRSDTAEVVRELAVGDEFVVLEHKSGWLKFVCDDIEGWIWHRSGEKLHVVSADSFMKREDLLVLGIDDAQLESPHTVIEMDDSNPERELLTHFYSQFSFEGLKEQTKRFHSFAYDCHRALATKSAREAILEFFSCRLQHEPIRLDELGSVEEVLLLLSHYFLQEEQELRYDNESHLLSALGSRLEQCILDKANQVAAQQLLMRCTELLQAAPQILPKGRGAMRILESTHPYHDNMDEYWVVSIPGAKKIRVVFDPRSKSESGCDWIAFYKRGSNRTERFGETQYGGRGGSETWPGCGGREPLIIDAESFEVYFHSDSSQNDWGFKLYAIGIFDEDDTFINVETSGKTMETTVALLAMYCWILSIASSLATHLLPGDEIYEFLYSYELIQTLAFCLEEFPQHIKIYILQIVINLTQNLKAFHRLPCFVVERVRDILNAQLRAQYETEERVESKSQYLQVLVQCSLALDLAIDSGHYVRIAGDQYSMPISGSLDERIRSRYWASEELIPAGLHQFEISVKKLTGTIVVGIAEGVSDSEQPKFFIQWSDAGIKSCVGDEHFSDIAAIGSPLREGDALSIQLNFNLRILVVRKNRMLAAVICGQSGCESASSWHALDLLIKASKFRVAVVVTDPTDQIDFRMLYCSPIALLPTPVHRSWYTQLVDAVGMMLDFRENRMSNVIAKESRHPFLTEGKKTSRDTVHVPGAIALEIRFDKRTKLPADDKIRFYDNQGENDPKFTFTGLNGDVEEDKHPHLFSSEASRRGTLLRAGDHVVRSLDWEYGNEDGGAGSIGTVLEVVAWEGDAGSALRIRWEVTGNENVYRFGAKGRYDIQALRLTVQPFSSLVINGDSLLYEIESGSTTQSALNLSSQITDFCGSVGLTGSTAVVLDLDPETSKLNFGDDYTLEFWLYIDSDTIQLPDSLDGDAGMELVRIGGSNSRFSLVVSIDRHKKFVLTAHADSLSMNGSTTTLDDSVDMSKAVVDEWIHVAFVWCGSKALLYQNGQLAYSSRCKQREQLRHIPLASIQFGEHYFASQLKPLHGHLCDVRIWDVALQMEQVRSHANGLEGADRGNRPTSMQSGTPRQLKSALSPLIVPPSPPRSPSRAFVVPPHMKKFVTTNRTGKDLVAVRLNGFVSTSPPTEASRLDDVVYFEAHALTTGKMSIGWIWKHAKLSGRDIMVGEDPHSFGIEPAQRLSHFAGTINKAPAGQADDNTGIASPRASGGGTFFSDIFSRNGDIIGCAFERKTLNMLFYINGELVATTDLHSTTAAYNDRFDQSATSDDHVNGFDKLVEEMFSIGFSRQVSEESVAASGAADVSTAVNWLLSERPLTPRRGGTQISSPKSPIRRSDSALSSPFSPRHHSSTRAESDTFSVIDAVHQGGFAPAASLGHQGAQAIAWNFGQRPFRHIPKYQAEEMQIVSVLEACGISETDIQFEIFDYGATKWEPVVYRHKVQEFTPRVVGWWKLDEGSGMVANDASGNDQTGRICVASPASAADDSRRQDEDVWDDGCIPDIVAAKRNQEGSSPFFSSHDQPKKDEIQYWGYKFFVIPHFSLESIGRRRFHANTIRLAEGSNGFLSRHDQQLVKYVNKIAQTKQLTVNQLLRVTWGEIAPDEEEMLRWPVLMEITTAQVVGSSISDEKEELTIRALTRAGDAHDRLARRFKVLQEFNALIHRVLPYVGFRSPSVGTTTSLAENGNQVLLHQLMAEHRFRMFYLVKRAVWEDAIGRTNDSAVAFELTLNRVKAMRHRATGKVDLEGRYTLFSQAFRQLNTLDGGHFRRAENIYHVQFLGENAQDAGGPYRETFAQYCEELQSGQLPLLLTTSNAQHNVGIGREKWILNPGATQPMLLQMYEFLGKLLGASIRSKHYLPLHIALLVWKKLVGECVTVEDLAAMDTMIMNSMQKMRTIDQLGVTDEMFEDVVMETFTTLSADNRVVELKAGGASIPVTFATRCEYADLVERYRLQEFDDQIAAVFRGLAKVVPAKLLSCFCGSELEQLVCGSPEIDVDLLQRCTEYSSCNASDEHIVWFWQVLRNFSHDERSAFLRFVWGRSRLPANEKEFPQLFKLQSFSKQQPGRSADLYLPIAHTCFFSVELPIYSCEQVLRDKLLYAIYNCQEIDADGDSVAANQLGWEE